MDGNVFIAGFEPAKAIEQYRSELDDDHHEYCPRRACYIVKRNQTHSESDAYNGEELNDIVCTFSHLWRDEQGRASRI